MQNVVIYVNPTDVLVDKNSDTAFQGISVANLPSQENSTFNRLMDDEDVQLELVDTIGDGENAEEVPYNFLRNGDPEDPFTTYGHPFGTPQPPVRPNTLLRHENAAKEGPEPEGKEMEAIPAPEEQKDASEGEATVPEVKG